MKLAPTREAEIVEELAQHLEDRYEELLTGGATDEEAYRAALKELSETDLLAQELGQVERPIPQEPVVLGTNRSKNMIADLWQDIRYGIRAMKKAPGFTAVVVITLALGIGANTAIFSLLDAVFLKSLPVQKPAELVLFGKGEGKGLTNGFPNGSSDLFSYPFYQDVRQHKEAFADVAALLSISWEVHGRVHTNVETGDAEQIKVQPVSGNYFSVLGVQASAGRIFNDGDDLHAGAHPLAVVSHAWWEHRLGGDPAAI